VREATLWRALIGVDYTVIEGVEFDEDRGWLTVRIRPVASRRGRCGRCERRSVGYDRGRGRRRWRTLDLGTITTWVEAEAPRVRCRVHGVVVAHVPWARHDAGFTRVFEEQVAWLATQTSKFAVTELMRIAWRSVGAVIARVWGEIEASTDLMGGLTKIGIDEVSYRRGRLFLTVVIDHDTGRLVWAGQGQSKATLQQFFDLLGPQRAAQITHVTADAAEYIADVVATNCAKAVQAADPFHVVKWANDALGEVRLEVWRQTRKIARANSRGQGRAPLDADQEFPAHQRLKILTRSRYALWKNPENLTESQRAKLDWIAATDPRLWRAYQLKEALRMIFRVPANEAPDVLDAWVASARRCQIPQFVDLARMVNAQRGPILIAIDNGLSNGRTEAVNNKIRLRTRMAFGFKNPHALIALCMLSLGGHRPTLPSRQ
jgi:transposase